MLIKQNSMGRLTNEKCWACSLLTATEARKLHDEPSNGDRCWRDDTCHSRRSYYRQGRGRTARRNSLIEELTVPIPDFPYVVLSLFCCFGKSKIGEEALEVRSGVWLNLENQCQQ